MGKINLNAMKQARKEQEIETPVQTREGEHSLSKSLRKRYLKSSCLPLTSAL